MALAVSNASYLCFNTAALLLLLNGLRAVITRPLPHHLEHAGPFQFLTNLSLIVTVVSLVFNIVAALPLPRFFDFFKTTLTSYATLTALVLEFIVSSIYWSLKLFFLHLIVNTDEIPPDKFIPLWLDFTVHLAPFIVLSIDSFFLKRDTPKRLYAVIVAIMATLTVGYWLLLEHLVSNAKLVYPLSEYPYPFLNVDHGMRAVIFAGVIALALVVVYVVEQLEARGSVKAKVE
jgi:hypothetical protein